MAKQFSRWEQKLNRIIQKCACKNHKLYVKAGRSIFVNKYKAIPEVP